MRVVLLVGCVNAPTGVNFALKVGNGVVDFKHRSRIECKTQAIVVRHCLNGNRIKQIGQLHKIESSLPQRPENHLAYLVEPGRFGLEFKPVCRQRERRLNRRKNSAREIRSQAD